MKFLLYVETGFVGARHEEQIEIDDEEWNKMNEAERSRWLDDEARNYLFNSVEYGWENVKD